MIGLGIFTEAEVMHANGCYHQDIESLLLSWPSIREIQTMIDNELKSDGDVTFRAEILCATRSADQEAPTLNDFLDRRENMRL